MAWLFVDTEVVRISGYWRSMKKPRWTRWRWLMALLLGVGTWWGVGWWLYPKPYLHIRRSVFPDNASSDQKDKKSDEPKIEVIEVPGERDFSDEGGGGKGFKVQGCVQALYRLGSDGNERPQNLQQAAAVRKDGIPLIEPVERQP